MLLQSPNHIPPNGQQLGLDYTSVITSTITTRQTCVNICNEDRFVKFMTPECLPFSL